MRQKNQVELNLGTGAKGEARSAAAQETEARAAKASLERPAVAGPSMEAVVERENLKKALAQVKRNKGTAGDHRLPRRLRPAHPQADPAPLPAPPPAGPRNPPPL